MGRLMFLLIFGLTGAGILISLGVWQVQRLAWKEGVLSEIEARIDAAPVALPETVDPEADRYLPVEVSGRFLPGEIHVLVSIKRVGPGFLIIAPFETETGRRILVDRGFVPSDAKAAPRTLGPETVTGNLHWPRETDSYTPDPDLEANTWFAREVPDMAAHLDTDEVLLIARSETDPAIRPIPVDTAGIPNDHLQYAITWFSLAAIWIMMTALFLWRSRAPRQA
ncbi:SURF1 family protein [Aestuariivita boseongensis]|uniref:SURF1 family protein n=1 Tax=Aestuariivita boseongensis TaxID=1470562 RepID=UPI000680CC03|nr:SURF1 family protein [Aestuariivita boseongensis]